MNTSTKESGLEIKVGLFLCLGLVIIAAMILEFGLGGKQGLFRKYYTLVVDLPDADGLLKNSQVVLGGAGVGFVADKPVLSNSLGTVRVTVKVDEKIKIPIGSIFKVSSSGLLGDKYVAIQTAKGFDPDKFDPKDASQSYQPVDPTQPTFKVYDPADPNQKYEAGEAILGLHTAGIADIAEALGPAVKKLSAELDDVQTITTSLKDGVLSGSSQKNLEDTLASLKVIGQNWQDASNKLPGIATGAQEAVDKANQTMATAKDAAADLQKTLQNVRTLIQKASEGQGLVGQLLTNRQLADNFNALVINLREHGILWYRNSANTEPPASSPAPGRGKKQQ